MKKMVFCFIYSFLSIGINAQSLMGAWESYQTSETGENLRSVLIVSDAYQVLTTFNSDSGAFISSNGGSWKLEGNTMTEKVEFNSNKPEMVGSEISFTIALNDSIFKIVGSDIKMKRIDGGGSGELQGIWLMSGRTIDGLTQLINTDGPRKTMKILSATRFQWIEYNTETKQFMATGGGTYTTINGIYTEMIEFFSRDITKVGLQLKFDYKLTGGNWHHSGFSTKGDPIDEVWIKRN